MLLSAKQFGCTGGDQRSTQINCVGIHKRQSQNAVRLYEMSVLTFETLRR